MTFSACSENKKTNENMNTQVPAISLANMDTTAIPGNDFNQFVNGGWMAANPLKPEYARYGSFDKLQEQTQVQVKSLIEELSKKTNEQGSISQKIGDLYALAMDSNRLNKAKAAPILPYLEKINKLNNKEEISGMLAMMFRDGTSPFFRHDVSADDKNSTINILHLSQGGFRMGDRDYYLTDDTRSQNLRAKYVELIEKLFTLAGYTPEQAKDASTAVMKIETQLAKIASSRVELRDPVANYHKITLAELNKLSPEIKWDSLFESVGIKGLSELNVGQLKPIAEVSTIIKTYPLQDIKYYLLWSALNNAAPFLSDDFSNASFDFYGKTLSGKQAQRERWKRAVDVVNGGMGEAVGQIYVAKYFPPSSKEKMMDLVKNLQNSLGERIENLSWMGEQTKDRALDKLANMNIKIGYPDKWRDYSGLTIDKSKSYWENVVAFNRFDYDYMINKFNKPVDKDEWLMTPQTVNAYYNPSANDINFPAAILQPPFFNPNADDAVNYGGIGVVIGHEMTHGFDDQGRQFDKDGNLSDWWTAEDAKRFNERAQVLVDFFSNIVVLDTVHANGKLTLGENIADQGGLQISWQAYQTTLKEKEAPAKIDGFTDAQRFFIGYGSVWASNIRDEEILRLTKIDPHSLAKWRINGAVPQIDIWYDAFNVTPANKMYIPKEKRVAIW